MDAAGSQRPRAASRPVGFTQNERQISKLRRLIKLRFPTPSRVQSTVPVTVEIASMQTPPSPGNSIFVTLLSGRASSPSADSTPSPMDEKTNDDSPAEGCDMTSEKCRTTLHQLSTDGVSGLHLRAGRRRLRLQQRLNLFQPGARCGLRPNHACRRVDPGVVRLSRPRTRPAGTRQRRRQQGERPAGIHPPSLAAAPRHRTSPPPPCSGLRSHPARKQ